MGKLVTLAFLALVSLALGCKYTKNGCSRSQCSKHAQVSGIWDVNTAFSAPFKGFFASISGGSGGDSNAGINLEYFDDYSSVNNFYAGVNSLVDCCNACQQDKNCAYFQFFKQKGDPDSLPGFPDHLKKKGGLCFSRSADGGAPQALDAQSQLDIRKGKKKGAFVLSYVGGRCDKAVMKDDPHLVGAHGTPFDFNGKIDQSFCLTSDKSLHINVVMRGYEDSRTTGATLQANGKALRTWIKEVGLLWLRPGTQEQHSLLMVARDGKQQERGDRGFMARIAIDGVEMDVPSKAGDSLASAGAELSLKATEKMGPFDVDVFSLRIPGVADIEFRMRVAHPALQTPEDAQAHFNLYLTNIRATEAVHGVLGQTFRETEERANRAKKFSSIAALLKAPVAADGVSGKGFLDGSVEDYITPHVLSPACKFGAFAG